MDLPEKPDSYTAFAVGDALAAARTHRVMLVGRLKPVVLESVLSYLRSAAGDLKIVDNAWDAETLLYSEASTAWLLSGLTNYHAMYDQLYAIRAVCRRQNTPMFVLIPQLPDTIGRRDHYGEREMVPAAWRQPSEACVFEGQAMERSIEMGGLGNGTLNAIDDFLSEISDEGADFAWAQLRALNGMYVLFDAEAAWACDLARCILRLRTNEALFAMNDDEFRAYLAGLNARPGQPDGAP